MLFPPIKWIKNISGSLTWQRLSLVCRWVMGESASTHHPYDPSKKTDPFDPLTHDPLFTLMDTAQRYTGQHNAPHAGYQISVCASCYWQTSFLSTRKRSRQTKTRTLKGTENGVNTSWRICLRPALNKNRLPLREQFVFTARRYASAVYAMALCLCLSVTSRCSAKTDRRSITSTVLHDSPGTLFFWCRRSPPVAGLITRNSTHICATFRTILTDTTRRAVPRRR